MIITKRCHQGLPLRRLMQHKVIEMKQYLVCGTSCSRTSGTTATVIELDLTTLQLDRVSLVVENYKE